MDRKTSVSRRKQEKDRMYLHMRSRCDVFSEGALRWLVLRIKNVIVLQETCLPLFSDTRPLHMEKP